jgi:hypothetical protein
MIVFQALPGRFCFDHDLILRVRGERVLPAYVVRPQKLAKKHTTLNVASISSFLLLAAIRVPREPVVRTRITVSLESHDRWALMSAFNQT